MNADGVVTDLIDAIEIGIVHEVVGTGDGTALLKVSIDEQFLIRVERVSGPGPHMMKPDKAIRVLVKLLAEEWPADTKLAEAALHIETHSSPSTIGLLTDEIAALRAQIGNQNIAEFLGCSGFPRCRCGQKGGTDWNRAWQHKQGWLICKT